MCTLIGTAKLNDIDPQAWLADVLEPSPAIPSSVSQSFCPGTGDPQRITRYSGLNAMQPLGIDAQAWSSVPAAPYAKSGGWKDDDPVPIGPLGSLLDTAHEPLWSCT